MGYNRNTLIKVIEVQNITLEHTRRGITQKWVYEHVVNEGYRISVRTYYRYLSLNAKAITRNNASQLKINF